MLTINYSIENNKVTINSFMNSQPIGSQVVEYAFTEGETIYGFKLTPKGDKAAPIVIKNGDYYFEKFARLDGSEAEDEAIFAITAHSRIQDKEIATKLAAKMIAYLNA